MKCANQKVDWEVHAALIATVPWEFSKEAKLIVRVVNAQGRAVQGDEFCQVEGSEGVTRTQRI